MSYYDLGVFKRTVTTESADAQLWFDRGLNWLYGYNHAEAIACFEKALAQDGECAMAHWGIAYASGPNYNLPWHLMDPKGKAMALGAGYDAAQLALSHAAATTDVEQAMIGALTARYPQRDPIDDQSGWNDDFADAMRGVYQSFPDDLEVCAIFCEGIMVRTPWKMWDLKTGGVAKGAGTAEAQEVLERTFDNIPAAWEHPGVLHLYIHLMEMSPFPQKALRAGDCLRDLVPDAGHLIHMPTHIDVLCGQYRDVVVYNQKAIAADRKFLAQAGAMNVYSLYRAHDHHFAIYGAMFLGQYTPAIKAAQELIDTTPEDLLRVESPPMADFIEGYLSMKQHVLVRFGKWQDIVDQPLPDDQDLYCATTAMMRYAKSVAHSATGNVAEAEVERDAFLAAKANVPDTRRVHNNTVVDLLEIAQEMLNGELEYRRGNYDVAYDHLRRSVQLDDDLPYDEPWGWMQPTRHALGALLLEQGHAEEAEAVYRADLGLDQKLSRACQHPNNLWSLHGLHECLTRRGETTEALLIKQALDQALARAEVTVNASCYCRQNAAA
ncbi:MAG: tetratricopeptide repeat protein [Rhodospirillaceae bacterium]|jgi:tetratricopeptide (TPR) repeat protein|nr:tetratricopeptide repeat protein [Rhodospirillaceae bacterium]MBT5191083.1 tetratricopeptide repeat protein [Rhodospirillaceae bacterium]MBT5899094.1 tetratricopeptide repeat protein [Rhodospirillaceae bacterium]MBT7758097.1 tetratricopeptide repeat protein [Rhodospirillaceae bacterium]